MKVSAPIDPPASAVPPAIGIPPPVTPAAPRMARWPAWHAGVDQFLRAAVLLTAVLAGLFIARNSDVWRHLAAGRLIAQMKYPFGSDPFSFTGAGRVWVNQNWLYDLIGYGLYSADTTGAALVVAKALAFAATFVLLFSLRRPSASMWAWCVAAALGVLACAPQATLRPTPFALALLAAALVTLFRGDWATRRWRMPMLFGGLVAVWANVDASAFLGPFLVVLLLAGELVQRRLVDPTDGGVLAPPPADALLRTLPLALAGWLLNPTFLLALANQPGEAIGQLFPAELTFGYRPLVADDPQLSRRLAFSAYTGEFFKTESLGGNANGYALLALLALGGLLPLFAFRHTRAAHVLAWIGFALLPLANYGWVPFAAVLCVPLAAGYANLVGSNVRLAAADDQRSRVLILSAGIGRILCVFAALALVLAAVPGWLHPRVSDDPGYARRIDWGVEADPTLRATCEVVERWREGQHLPAGVRLLTAHPEFGDYAAWFAPGERSYVNTRYQFHRAELPELVEVRKALRPVRPDTDRPTGDLRAIADKHAAGGIALGQGFARLDPAAPYRAAEGFGPAGSRAEMYARLWRLDGRTAVVGRSDTPEYAGLSRRLAFDPGRAAFGHQSPPLPDGSAAPATVPADNIVARFLARPQPPTAATDDALAYLDRAERESRDADEVWAQRVVSGSGALAGSGVMTGWYDGRLGLNTGLRKPGDAELAYELLAVRAARSGANKTPDDPTAHRVMASVAQLRYFAQAQVRDASLIPLTAMERAAARYPAPDQPRDRLTLPAVVDGMRLAVLHAKAQHFDMALNVLNGVMARLQVAAPADTPPPPAVVEFVQAFENATRTRMPPLLAANEKPDALATKGPDWVRKKIEEVRDEAKQMYAQRNEQFNARMKAAQPMPNDFFAAGKLTLAEQFILAIRLGLPQKALDLVPDNLAEMKPADFTVRLQPLAPQNAQAVFNAYPYLLAPLFQFGRDPHDVDLRLQTIALMIRTGRVEAAADQLKAVGTWLDDQTAQQPGEPGLPYWRDAVAALNAEVAWLVGDHTRVTEWVRERIKSIPKVDAAEAIKALDASRAAPLVPDHVGSLLGVMACLEWHERTNKVAAMANALREESRRSYEQGLSGLASGHSAAAREAFVRSLKPQGVPLDKLGIGRDDVYRAAAERYLRLLLRYAE